LDLIRRTNPQVRRLIVAAGLFVAWISILALLAATSSQPVVLSRPQFLVSNLDVIVQIDGNDKNEPSREVTVIELHWPQNEKAVWEGRKITVMNLSQCAGWEGPGLYILPLEKKGDSFVVAWPAPSPGFEPSKAKPHIYRETPETLRQLKAIKKGE
jgi:hypothetical protein